MPSKDEALAAIRGRPTAFTYGGRTVWLRPITHQVRKDVRTWWAANEAQPDAGLRVQEKLAAAVLTDQAGGLSLTEEDVAGLDTALVDAVAAEATRRAGLDGEPADAGKASSPATPS